MKTWSRPFALLTARGRRGAGLGLLGQAFDSSPIATIITDESMRIVAANPAYERLTGLHRSACIGSLPGVEGSCPDMAARCAGPCEVWLRRREGDPRRVWMSWARIGGEPGIGGLHVATFAEPAPTRDDIDDWKHRARHDALTGLPNREHLEAELERSVARAARHGHRLAVLFIDLDGFKLVNDVLGHAAGDGLLARVGQRLRHALRAEDFVARYGGDEFIAVLEQLHEDAATDAGTAAEAVLHALRGDARGSDGIDLPVSASIGIALYPEHGADPAALLRAADGAMYRAKHAGGHSFAFSGAGAAPTLARPQATLALPH